MNKKLPGNVDDVLNSFKGMQQQELNPFFNTRLQAGLDARLGAQVLLPQRWLAWMVATLAVVFIINISVSVGGLGKAVSTAKENNLQQSLQGEFNGASHFSY